MWFSLTRTVIKCLTVEILIGYTSNNTTLVNLEKGLSDNWWAHFKYRYPELTSHTPDSLDRAKTTPEALETFFGSYENIIYTHNLQEKPRLI